MGPPEVSLGIPLQIAEATFLLAGCSSQHPSDIVRALRRSVSNSAGAKNLMILYTTLEIFLCAGRSGLAVACLTAVREVLGSNRVAGSYVYHKNHCDLQPWAQAVCTLPAVPRSTQPSTLRRTVNEYQLSG